MNEPDLRCYHHPEREATSQCDRCGDYLCSWCVQEHDELHVCARCFEDIRPRGEIGHTGTDACVINALTSSYWLVALLGGLLPRPAIGILALVSVIMWLVAIFVALSDVRGRAHGELAFRWSVATSALGSVLLFPLAFLTRGDIRTAMHALLVILLLPLTSVVLLGASALNRAKPTRALIVALLAPLMFGALLFTRLYSIVLTW